MILGMEWWDYKSGIPSCQPGQARRFCCWVRAEFAYLPCSLRKLIALGFKA